MKIFTPSTRTIHRATKAASPRLKNAGRRNCLRLGAAAMGLGLLACSSDEPAAGEPDGGSDDCSDGDPTDGSKLIAPSDGEEYGEMIIKVRVDRLARNFGLMETTVEPKQLLVPHTHQFDDQVVYVIAGELEFEFGGDGGEGFVASTGSYVIKPRKLSHGFWNPSDSEEARYIEMSTRTFFEPFVEDSAGATTKKEVDQIAETAGIEFHYRDIVRLFATHQLKSVKGMDEPMPGIFEPNGKSLGG